MGTFAIPSQRLDPGTAIVSLTGVQRALWQLGLPILDAGAVVEYKKRAKRGMLWRATRWQLLAMAVLVALVSLGRQWGRAAAVGAAAVLLITLFGWLVSALDLQWFTKGYRAYRELNAVPPHVSATASALLSRGVAEEQIGVEYLKSDPILFVEDTEHQKRYDLIIW